MPDLVDVVDADASATATLALPSGLPKDADQALSSVVGSPKGKKERQVFVPLHAVLLELFCSHAVSMAFDQFYGVQIDPGCYRLFGSFAIQRVDSDEPLFRNRRMDFDAQIAFAFVGRLWDYSGVLGLQARNFSCMVTCAGMSIAERKGTFSVKIHRSDVVGKPDGEIQEGEFEVDFSATLQQRRGGFRISDATSALEDLLTE